MDFILWKKKLDSLLDKEEAAMFQLLEQLVAIDSGTDNAAGVNRVGDRLQAWLGDAGFNARRLEKAAIAEDESWQENLADARMASTHAREAGPGIALIGHMDTVFPAGEAAKRPFRLDRGNDRATGPGVADMKAGLVTMLFAARALVRSGLMPCPLTMMFSPDEELGSPTGSKALAAHLPGALAVLCAEPGGIGEKVTTSRKGSGHMRMLVRGRAAHAGRNYEEGASANVELASKIVALNRLLDLPNGRTVNVGLIKGGVLANTVSPLAEARIHLTYRTLEDGRKAVADIRKLAANTAVNGTSCSITGGLRLYPLEKNAAGQELFRLVADAGKALGMNIKGQHYESAAESGFCASGLGIPAICCMGPEGENIHSVTEYMRPSTLLPRCKLLALSALAAAYHFGADGCA